MESSGGGKVGWFRSLKFPDEELSPTSGCPPSESHYRFRLQWVALLGRELHMFIISTGQLKAVSTNFNQFQPVSTSFHKFQPVSTVPNQFLPVLMIFCESLNHYCRRKLKCFDQFRPVSTSPNQFLPVPTSLNQFSLVLPVLAISYITAKG